MQAAVAELFVFPAFSSACHVLSSKYFFVFILLNIPRNYEPLKKMAETGSRPFRASLAQQLSIAKVHASVCWFKFYTDDIIINRSSLVACAVLEPNYLSEASG